MSPESQTTISLKKWVPLRLLQFAFTSTVMSLAAYTLSVYKDWAEVRFTVAASAFAILSFAYLFSCGMRYHPNHPHEFVTLVLDFINWGMFLAVWISLAVGVSDNSHCLASEHGHLHVRPCQTLYSAFALAIADWILFTVSLWMSSIRFSRHRKSHVSRKDDKANQGQNVE